MSRDVSEPLQFPFLSPQQAKFGRSRDTSFQVTDSIRDELKSNEHLNITSIHFLEPTVYNGWRSMAHRIFNASSWSASCCTSIFIPTLCIHLTGWHNKQKSTLRWLPVCDTWEIWTWLMICVICTPGATGTRPDHLSPYVVDPVCLQAHCKHMHLLTQIQVYG